jgi:hypothetical protein
MILDILNIPGIEASSVYQSIYAKGYAQGLADSRAKVRAEVAREVLICLGRKRWGEPDERVLSQIMAIDDRDRLEPLLDRVLDASASSWDELFPPAASSV